MPLFSVHISSPFAVHEPQPAHDHKMHPMRGRGCAKTHSSPGKQGVDRSHPGQKDRCVSDSLGGVGGEIWIQGLSKATPISPDKATSLLASDTTMVTVPGIPTLCHSSGIQGPKTDYTKSFG